MANRTIYCTEDAVKIHIGDVRLPVNVTYEGFIEAASSEMDGRLGSKYKVPISVSPNVPDEKTTSYWLQSVCAMIAAGRMLVSFAAAGSQTETNAYGLYLLRTAFAQIDLVVNGDLLLGGAEPQPTPGEEEVEAPQYGFMLNQDAGSQVDIFYDNFEEPGFTPSLRDPQVPYPPYYPGAL